MKAIFYYIKSVPQDTHKIFAALIWWEQFKKN